MKIFKKLIFPDHYRFSKDEIKNIISEAESNNYQVIMTEKDYFKVKDFDLINIGYLKVSLMIENQEKLISLIKKRI